MHDARRRRSAAPPCLAKARRRLKWEAWLFIIVAIFLFWPAAFIPCCIDGCYEESEPERAIYVATPAVGATAVVAVPQQPGFGPYPSK